MIHEETGQLMSDATRRAYMETGDLSEAYKSSELTHNEWLKIWGDENTYVQAHGEFGTELPQAFGLDRTMMSVTTDSNVARYFAGENGKVYEGLIPRSQLIPQTIDGAGESEYLIKFGAGGFK
jgi:filamentous hemagglutinin